MAILNSHPGSWFGLPDFGITEKIQSLTSPQKSYTQQGGSNLFGPAPQQAAAPKPTVLGTKTVNPGGGVIPGAGAQQQITGGGGSGGGAPTSNLNVNSVLQPTPQQPGIDFDALIAPALQALDAYIQPLNESYNANVGQIESNRASQLATNTANITGQQDTLNQARTNQQNLTENAADEARRQYSEIQQGLQSRYGGTTGTGAFAAELAGRQTAGNIGQLRQGLSQSMLAIDNKLQQVQEVGRIAAQDIEDQATGLKSQAKAQLDQQLADIRNQQGQLQAHKAELAANAIQMYQQTVNNVNAQNASFKQNLFLKQQDVENTLKVAQQKAATVASSFNANDYLTNVDQTTPVGSSVYGSGYDNVGNYQGGDLNKKKQTQGGDSSVYDQYVQQLGLGGGGGGSY